MNNYQQPEATTLDLHLEKGTLVTASLERMNILNDDWDDDSE